MPLRQAAPVTSAARGTAAARGGSPASPVAAAGRPCCQRPGHCAAQGQLEPRTGEPVMNEESASHPPVLAAEASAGRLRLSRQE